MHLPIILLNKNYLNYLNYLKQFLNFAAIILIINILLSGFFQISLDRPLFYYEYLLLPLAFSFYKNKILRGITLGVFVLSDAIISLARFYYFDTFNYVRKFPSLFLSHFSFQQYFIAVLGMAVFIALLYFVVHNKFVLAVNTSLKDKKRQFGFFAVAFIIIYFFDIVLGTSALYFKPKVSGTINVGKSLVKTFYVDAKIYAKNYLPLSQIASFENTNDTTTRPSLAYQYLFNDTSAHQLLIIVESWGLMQDTLLRNKQIQPLLDLVNHGYQVSLDSSVFHGGTSQAEARELLNKSGEAYYAVVQKDDSLVSGLIQQKNDQGYYTQALQSFSGFHSSGYHFRKNLQFNDIKEYAYFKSSFPSNNNDNHNNHYQAVNDELVFNYGFKQTLQQPKSFTYILTINTHLPFKTNHLPEPEAQFNRLKDQFTALSHLLKQYRIGKVVLVGDHPPPFYTPNQRRAFSEKQVPALIISIKNEAFK